MTAEPLPLEPSEADRYTEAARFVRHERRRGHLRLVASDGETLELPERLAAVLDDAASALAAGDNVRVLSTETSLTTTEAAEILGVSRPTLVRLLEQGELSYAQPGTHRRLKLSDVLAYREERRQRRAALDGMVRVSVDEGLYDLLEEVEVEVREASQDEEGNGRT